MHTEDISPMLTSGPNRQERPVNHSGISARRIQRFPQPACWRQTGAGNIGKRRRTPPVACGDTQLHRGVQVEGAKRQVARGTDVIHTVDLPRPDLVCTQPLSAAPGIHDWRRRLSAVLCSCRYSVPQSRVVCPVCTVTLA
jgi:hypothetical protein